MHFYYFLGKLRKGHLKTQKFIPYTCSPTDLSWYGHNFKQNEELPISNINEIWWFINLMTSITSLSESQVEKVLKEILQRKWW